MLASALGKSANADESRAPLRPVIDENGWWQIAGNPDLGELSGDRQEPVDFGIWQAADGTWQLWGCIRGTKEPGNTRLLYRWEGANLTDTDWEPKGIAMQGKSDHGETPGGLQAPYVFRHDGKYWMVYGDWVNLCLASSDDGKHFERASIADAGPQLFGEGEDDNARDPMILARGDEWLCYYCAKRGEGGFFVRRSGDLHDWSDSRATKVLSGGSPGSIWHEAECPHVVEHEGLYYLFRTSKYRNEPRTTVYASEDPFYFGIDDDSKIVATLPVAAVEVVRHDGKYWLAALNPNLDGYRITSLEFLPPGDEAK